MILAIDIGNSNVVFGCVQGEEVLFFARLTTERSFTSEEYAINIKSILEQHCIDTQSIEGGIICSVVPPLSNVLRDSVTLLTGKAPLVVGTGLKTGLNILIDNPAQLGSDRVVDAVAATACYPAPLIVFDMGTATTISVIDAQKSYLGGMILPGVRLSLEALSHRTSQLPHISLDYTEQIVGKNTVDCMRSGIINGNASMVDGMIDRIEADLGQKATVIATGGLASVIIPHCKHHVHYDQNLLLKGLLLLYQMNTPQK